MTIDLYPPCVNDTTPTIGADIDKICEEIHDACKGFGTDESKLLQAMGSQTPEQRCKVHICYKKKYGKELKDVMKSECGKRAFGQALQYLAVAPDMAECHMIKDACKGMGTNEMLIVSILCGRTNEEMEILKKKFFDIFSKDLGSLLDSETGGTLEFLLLNLLQASEDAYDPKVYTADKMADDIETLYKAGQGRLGTKEKDIFKLLCKCPAEYLSAMNLAYADKHGITLSHMLGSELSGIPKEAAEFMFGMKVKPIEAVAKLINKACKGFGTNEILLSTALIRYTQILPQVAEAYNEMFGKSLSQTVKSETGGDYEKLLLLLIESA